MSKGQYLGEFEQLVLLAVMRVENAYGVPIRQEIEQRTGRSAAIGAVYATLDRLEEKGFVRSWSGEATGERGGRAKKHFAATGAGVAALLGSQRAVRQMMRGLRLATGLSS
jgi:DNA-binding PadR family transcriptional regulator